MTAKTAECKCHAAVMTPPGAAAIATIRLIGPDSIGILKRIFRSDGGRAIDLADPDRLMFGTIKDGPDTIDQVIVSADADRTEVDINCHAGRRVVERLILLLQQNGVEFADWQELISPHSIAEEMELVLPRAITPMAVAAIVSLDDWLERTIISLEKRPDSLADVSCAAKRLAERFPLSKRLLAPSAVVLAGAVNVGKSSLANTLTGSAQSIAADMPGTTRDWTCRLVDIDGLPIELIDTAGKWRGQDRPDCAIEQKAGQQTEKKISSAELILLILAADAEKLDDGAQRQLARLRKLNASAEIMAVINKIDIAAGDTRPKCDVCVSAKTGEGLEMLRAAIVSRLGFGNFDPAEPLVFTERQYHLAVELAGVESGKRAISLLKKMRSEQY